MSGRKIVSNATKMFAQQYWCIFAWLYHMLLSISKQWTITHLSALLEDLWCFHLFVSLKSTKPPFVQSKTNLSAHLRATNTLELWVLGLGHTLYKGLKRERRESKRVLILMMSENLTRKQISNIQIHWKRSERLIPAGKQTPCFVAISSAVK